MNATRNTRTANRSLAFLIVLVCWILIRDTLSNSKVQIALGVLFVIYIQGALVFGLGGNPHYMNPLHWLH